MRSDVEERRSQVDWPVYVMHGNTRLERQNDTNVMRDDQSGVSTVISALYVYGKDSLAW